MHTSPVSLVPVRPGSVVPVIFRLATFAIILQFQKVMKRRRKNGSHFFGIQPRDQRCFRIGSFARLRVVRVQQRYTGSYNKLVSSEVRRQLANVLDPER